MNIQSSENHDPNLNINQQSSQSSVSKTEPPTEPPKEMGEVHLIEKISQSESPQTLKLVGFSPTHQKYTEIAKFITLDPKFDHLSETKKQQIVDRCLDSYQKSVEVFEKTIGEISAQHPDAKKFTQEMLRRIYRVIQCYQEILNEQVPERSTREKLMKELTIKLKTDVEFSTYGDGTGAGSVGINPIAIEKVIKEGNLREQMLLIYASLWTALPKIFAHPQLIENINAKLEKLQPSFQINTKALDAMRAVAKEGEDPVVTFLSQAEPLKKFREEQGRIWDPNRTREKAPQVREVKDLSIREVRATLKDYVSEDEFDAMRKGEKEGENLGNRHVQWIRGRDLFRVSEKSDFYAKAIQYGGLPIVTGPSGTTDGYLLGAKYLDMDQFQEQAILALTGWMVRAGDHTFHEIKEAGTWHGMNYAPGPEAFENVYTGDPNFREIIGNAMEREGFKLPGYYLTSEYQQKVADELKKEGKMDSNQELEQT